MASELIRRCERCRQLIEPSYPCFNCGHMTDVAKEEDSKLATTYTIDGKAIDTSRPATVGPDKLSKIPGGILDPYAWALAKAKLEAEAPATVEDTRLTGGPLDPELADWRNDPASILYSAEQWAKMREVAELSASLGDEDSPEAYEDELAEWLNAPMGPYAEPASSTRTPDGGSPAYRALLDAAWQLHIAKNTGYAGHSPDPWANFRQCEAFGISAADGVLTRMSDKWSRLQSLWGNPERDCVGESIKDTLVDLSAYALVLVCLLEEDE